MRLQRTQCFGPCPAYSVAVDSDGSVYFDGTYNVLVMGHHLATLSKQAKGKLFATMGA